MSLVEVFSQVKDPRRAQGKRYSLEQVMSLVFLAYLCGYHSFRKIVKFGEASEGLLKEAIGLSKLPSYVTIREVLKNIDEQSYILAFNRWAKSYVGELETGDCLSIDGKSLASTLENYTHTSQDFKSIVSVFAQTTGLVYQIEAYRNKKVSEIEILRSLLSSLQSKGLVICADALHCQKKQ